MFLNWSRDCIGEKMSCGHDKKYFYFHPAAGYGSTRFRCAACDDPAGNTQFMKDNPLNEVIYVGKIEYVSTHYPEGYVIRMLDGRNTAWYLNQSTGGWAANGSVFLSKESCDRAWQAHCRECFKKSKEPVAEGSD